MNFRKLFLTIGICLELSSGLCAAQEVTVTAASDLQFVMQDLGARFQSESKSVKFIYGSSGTFAQQLQNGAPFDMFFSANLDFPNQLEAVGLTEPGVFYQFFICS
jgi:molybdate transport system substrate-binding protein